MCYPLGDGAGDAGEDWWLLDVYPSPSLAESVFAPMSAAYVYGEVDSMQIDDHRVLTARGMPPGAHYQDVARSWAKWTEASDALLRKLVELKTPVDERVQDLAARLTASKEERSRPSPERLTVRVAYWETELRERVKAAGGIWRPRQKLWEMRYEDVVALGLESRVVVDE